MSEKKESEVIVGSVKKRLKLPKISRKPLLIAVVIVLAGGLIAGGIYLKNRSRGDNETKAFQEVEKKYQGYQSKSESNQAKKALQDYLKTNPKNKNYRATAEYYLANVWVTLGDNKSAKKYAELALKDTKNPTYSMYIFLGDVCKTLDDKQAAIKYYKEAINVLKPLAEKTPAYKAFITYANNNIELLSGKQQ